MILQVESRKVFGKASLAGSMELRVSEKELDQQKMENASKQFSLPVSS
jgi:hypothetical protein